MRTLAELREIACRKAVQKAARKMWVEVMSEKPGELYWSTCRYCHRILRMDEHCHHWQPCRCRIRKETEEATDADTS